MAEIKPFLLLGSNDCRSFQNSVASTLENWCLQWFAQAPMIGAELLDTKATSVTGTDSVSFSKCIEGGDGGWCRLECDELNIRLLAEIFLGPLDFLEFENRRDSTIPDQLISEALLDLLHIILGLEQDASVNERKNGGAEKGFTAELSIGDARIVVSFSELSLLPFLNRKPREANLVPVQSRRDAIGKCKLRLRGTLGVVGVGLSVLAELQCGDVLALDHHLVDPCYIEGPDGIAHMQGFLGNLVGRKAIHLTSEVTLLQD